jgi:hypothetical protein
LADRPIVAIGDVHGRFDLLQCEFAEVTQAPLNRLRAALVARLEGRWLLSHAGVPRRTASADVPVLSWRRTPVREGDHPFWVRDAFLRLGQLYPCGTAVLHGYTIARDVEIRSWRVGIDLRAYRSDRLCAAEIQGAHIRFHLAAASRD